MSRAASSAHSRQAPRRLDQERIVGGAIALVEEEGPAALTMRRLGSRLGVEGMAIYHHFESRDALLARMGEWLLEPLAALEFGADWRVACRRFATSLRDVAVSYPATFALLGLRPLDTPDSLRPVERLVGVLVVAGFDPAEALAVYRALVSYARGYALAEATGFTVDAERASGRRRLEALPRDEFPILAGRARELADLRADVAFEFGLDALLGGLGDPGKTSVTRVGA